MSAGTLLRKPNTVAERAHGTRAKFVHEGCHCLACRCANSDYETARQARCRAGMVWQARYAPMTRQYVVRNAETGEIVRRTFDRAEAQFERDHRNKLAHREAAIEPLWASASMIGKLRKHIARLQAAGSSINQIARTLGMSRTRIMEIVNGKRYSRNRPLKGRVKLDTVRKILDSAVHIAPGARVSGAGTERMIREMLAHGMSKCEIARLLGSNAHTPSLQIKTAEVLKSTETRVRCLHDRIWREQPEFRKFCKCPWWET